MRGSLNARLFDGWYPSKISLVGNKLAPRWLNFLAGSLSTSYKPTSGFEQHILVLLKPRIQWAAHFSSTRHIRVRLSVSTISRQICTSWTGLLTTQWELPSNYKLFLISPVFCHLNRSKILLKRLYGYYYYTIITINRPSSWISPPTSRVNVLPHPNIVQDR